MYALYLSKVRGVAGGRDESSVELELEHPYCCHSLQSERERERERERVRG